MVVSECLVEAEYPKIIVWTRNRSEKSYHETFNFAHEARTQLLLKGFIPSEDPYVWVNLTSDEVAEICRY